MPQRNHPIMTSPINEAKLKRKAKNRKKKRNNKSYEDEDDDFTVTTGDNRRGYLKNCIKKRLNNNYVKQINCVQDENVIFTDNKIYVSLAARSSLTSCGNNSLKKNRRVIYPTSDGYKITGFLRDYDFNYESPNRTTGKLSSSSEDALKFNLMKTCSYNSVVFEKVKVPSNKIPATSDMRILHINTPDLYEDKLFESFFDLNQSEINSYEADDEDDIQWNKFLELRKQGSSNESEHDNGPKMPLSDSGFGSQLLSCSFPADRNLKTSEIYLDEEAYDNSFNEELEKRVSNIFPDLCKSFSRTNVNNINNNARHEKGEKLS